MKVLLLLTLCWMVPEVRSATCNTNTATNNCYYVQNTKLITLGTSPADAAKCCDYCYLEPWCKVFTHEGGNGASGRCYLGAHEAGSVGAYPRVGCTSGTPPVRGKCNVNQIEVLEPVVARKDGIEVIGIATGIACDAGTRTLSLTSAASVEESVGLETADTSEFNWGASVSASMSATTEVGASVGVVSASASTTFEVSSSVSVGGSKSYTKSESKSTTEGTTNTLGQSVAYQGPGAAISYGYMDKYTFNKDNIRVRLHYHCTYNGNSYTKDTTMKISLKSFGKAHFGDMVFRINEGYCTDAVRACVSAINAQGAFSGPEVFRKQFNDCFSRAASPDFRGCDPGWTHLNGHCYQLYMTEKNYEEAKATCKTAGATLVGITNNSENERIRTLINVNGLTTAWIGLTDTAKEGTWVWETNEGFQYNNFKNGEPNGNTAENCATIEKGTGTWADYTCTHPLPFVCEQLVVNPFTNPDTANAGDFVQKKNFEAYLGSIKTVVDAYD